jgi:hypothetical protein
VNDLFANALQNLLESDMVGIMIQNRVNQNDKRIGMSFRPTDKLAGDVLWSVFEKVSQSNSRFNTLDTLIVTYIPLGYQWDLVSMQSRKRAARSPSWPI